MSVEPVGERLLIARFDGVVEFLADAGLDFVDHLRRIEAAESLLEEEAEQVGVLQIGVDGRIDTGVLNFHGDRAFGAGLGVDDHCTVDLSDGCGRDGFGIPFDEEFLG